VVTVAQVVAQACAYAGVALLASGLLAVAVHSAGYWRLERDQPPTLQKPEDPGDTES